MDSVGAGELPDAAAYGDQGATRSATSRARCRFACRRCDRWGWRGWRTSARRRRPPRGAAGRMAEASPGKDSVTGHWEMAGIVLDRPFPTFPHGFPADLIREFERRIGRATIGNVVASGTAIIDALGPEHMRTGAPIVYTSADSVFQIAAHERVIPIERAVPHLPRRVRARRREAWASAASSRVRSSASPGTFSARPTAGISRSSPPASRCSIGSSPRDTRSSPSARSRISSPAEACRAPSTPTSDDHGMDVILEEMNATPSRA